MPFSVQVGTMAFFLALLFAVGLMFQCANMEWREAQDELDTSSTADSRPSVEQMGLESAREKVPFHILTPQYLPEGFYPVASAEVFVTYDDANKDQVEGVLVSFFGDDTVRAKWNLLPDLVPQISVSQVINAEGEITVENSQLPSVPVRGFQAEVFRPDPIVDYNTVSYTVLTWHETDRGIGIEVRSPIPYEETLQVALSLR